MSFVRAAVVVLLASLGLLAGLPAVATAGVHYRPPALYPVGLEAGMGPVDLASGDVNGDGRVDLITADASMGPSASVSVLVGRGDGSFVDSAVYDLGTRPLSVAADDFDEDGLDDLVVPVDGENAVELWLSNGDETFEATSYPVAASSPTAVAVGDFDGDDHADAVVVGAGMALALLRGTGDGDLEEPISYAAGGDGYGTIEAGDVNGDGRDDVLAFPGTGNEAIAVLLGEADGTLADPVTTGLDRCCATRLIVTRVNPDGRDDVLVGYAFDPSLDLLLGGDDAALGPPMTVAMPAQAGSPGVGDFDGDGRVDLVIAFRDGHVAVHLGRGGGIFGPELSFAPGGLLVAPLGLDLNGDGFDDLATLERQTGSVGIAINAPAAVPVPVKLSFPSTFVLPPSVPPLGVLGDTVHLINDGAPPLRLGQVTITGSHATDFRLIADTCTGATIAINASCSVTVAFAPLAGGERAATLVVPGNAADGDPRIPLSGTAITQPPFTMFGDTSPPRVTLTLARQMLLRALKHGITIRVGCSEPCKIDARLMLERSAARRLGFSGRRSILAGHTTQQPAARAGEHRLRIALNRRIRRKLRTVNKVALTVKVTVRDSAGNASSLSRRLILRRR